MRIEYIGQFIGGVDEHGEKWGGVLVPELELHVIPGEVLELTTPEEREVGKRLLEQKDNWGHAPAEKGKAPSKGVDDATP